MGLANSSTHGSRPQDDWGTRLAQAEPAEGHGAHQKDSRYETPAFCHFQRQFHFIKRSLGDISCCCCALFCWKMENKSLLPTASQHMALPHPGHSWRHLLRLYPCGSAGKESACNVGDRGLILGLGRSPGEGKGYPLQFSGLENSNDCISPWGHKKSDLTERLSLSSKV